MMKRKCMAVFTALVLLMGCLIIPASGEHVYAAGKKLKVTCSQKTIALNCTTTIKTNVKATFQSSNKKIATVSSKGVVKGKKAGKVKITVTSKSNKKQKKSLTIIVKNQLVVTAPKNAKATLYVGDSMKVETNIAAKFESSKTSVATVSSTGNVVAKKDGTAKITVTAKKNPKLKKTVTITVKKKTESITEEKTTEQSTTEQQPTTEQQSTTEQQTTEQPAPETPEVINKNEADVSALTEILNDLNSKGISVPKDLNSSCYTWNKEGRLME